MTSAEEHGGRLWLVGVAGGQDIVDIHAQALKNPFWIFNPALLLTFHWAKQVTWLILPSMG